MRRAPSLAVRPEQFKLVTATCCFCRLELTACAGHAAQHQEPLQASGPHIQLAGASWSRPKLSAGAGGAAQGLETLTWHQGMYPGSKSKMGVRQLLQAEHAEDASRRLQAGRKGACIPRLSPGSVTAARRGSVRCPGMGASWKRQRGKTSVCMHAGLARPHSSHQCWLPADHNRAMGTCLTPDSLQSWFARSTMPSAKSIPTIARPGKCSASMISSGPAANMRTESHDAGSAGLVSDVHSHAASMITWPACRHNDAAWR